MAASARTRQALRRSQTAMCLVTCIIIGSTAALTAHAQQEDFLIANGLAPPDSVNLVDDDRYSNPWPMRLYVHNDGCPTGWPDSGSIDDRQCTTPAAATTVALVGDPFDPGSYMGSVGELRVYESSSVSIRDWAYAGTVNLYHDSSFLIETFADVGSVDLYDQARVVMNDGYVQNEINAQGGSAEIEINGGHAHLGVRISGTGSLTIRGGLVESVTAAGDSRTDVLGGSVWQNDSWDQASIRVEGGADCYALRARGTSTITVVGDDFAVDGVPVPLGPLPGTQGQLTGTLLCGDERVAVGCTEEASKVRQDIDPTL